MISFGAGVNSVAMAIMLIEDGWRGPIVFADTGSEWPETYCYVRIFNAWLKERGLEITVLAPEQRQGETAIPLYDYCWQKGIVPYLAARWCTDKWKIKPLSRWCRAREDQDNEYMDRLLGFAADEAHRAKLIEGRRYPLVEEGITRRECQRIIARAGLHVPIKSGCYFCPGQRLDGWRRLYYEYPDLYEKAARLEENADRRHESHITLDPHGISLREHAKRRWAGQMTMDLSQWLPCLCSL
jgi:hypothetical protein